MLGALQGAPVVFFPPLIEPEGRLASCAMDMSAMRLCHMKKHVT